jgi:HPt (histidine-containing phosphotransfer) domain-containing protein
MNLAQEEPAGTEAPIDYPAALRWVEGDHELLADLIAIFLEDCPRKLHELEQAIKEGKAMGVRQTAHSLKGMVACFSTKSAHGLAGEMETLGKAGDLAKASDLLATLLLEFARVLNHLKTADWQERVDGRRGPAGSVCVKEGK